MTELLESTVRKHCAMWETGAAPGSFELTPAAPLALFPMTTESAALEGVVRYNGDLSSQIYLRLYQTGPEINFYVYESTGSIRILYQVVVPDLKIQCSWSGAIALTWYHILCVLVNDGADNLRVLLYVDGVLVANSGVAVSAGVFSGGGTRTWQMGYSAVDWVFLGDIALARVWVGSWPAVAGMQQVPQYPATEPGLEGQWDMGPALGNTIRDSGGGGFDMPWIAGTQANASYAHYRFTGQPRGQLWQPR